MTPRRILGAAVAASVVLAPAPAGAQAATEDVVSDGFFVAAAWWDAVAGVLLPILVGLTTKYVAHSGVKAALLILLTTVYTAVEQAIGGEVALTYGTLGQGLLTYIVAVTTYFGFYKPVGLPRRLAPNMGIG